MDKTKTRNRARRGYRGSLFGPLILIALGVIFLLSNMGMLQGDVWSLILRLWPLLLIAMGLDGFLRREGLVASTLMAGLGVVFLMNNFGYLALNVWEVVLRLWPLLVIAVGFDLIIGRRSFLASLVGLVVILTLLAGGLWWFGARVQSGQVLQGQQISQALDEATSAHVIIDPGAGSLNLHALPGAGNLIEGTVPTNRGETVRASYTVNGGQGVYSLSRSGESFFMTGGERWQWDLGLSKGVPIDLEVNLGAGSATLDLTGLELRSLKVGLGVGNARITLPQAGSFQAQLNGAVGQTEVIVPQGTAVKIRSDTGLANINVPSGYQQDGDTYSSPGYGQATDRIELDISQAIGNISIR